MANNIFSEQINRIRVNADMTMEQFAEKLGVTKGAVSMWENKGVVPREEVLRKIAQTYNTSLDTLLGISVEEDTSQLQYIHRSLEKLDKARLDRAEIILRNVFDDIFEDGEEEDDGF